MPQLPRDNRLLDSLPPEHANRIRSASQLVELPLRIQLYGSGSTPHYLYFLTSGVASLVYTSERGATVELATIGSEGLVDAIFLLGKHSSATESLVQVNAVGYRLQRATVQHEFDTCAPFRATVLEFVQHQSIVSNQLVACNRLHRAEARFARWLLMVQDRIQSDSIEMTQEFFSSMLGTRRTTVAEVSSDLQKLGAITAGRGVVHIIDRPRLEAVACECYPILKQLYDSLYR